MSNKKYIIPPIILTCITATLFSSPITNEQDFIPTKNYNIPSINLDIDQNTNSGVSFFSTIENDSFIAYSNFINNIIENSKDIEPEIIKLVDKNFWDLLL